MPLTEPEHICSLSRWSPIPSRLLGRYGPEYLYLVILGLMRSSHLVCFSKRVLSKQRKKRYSGVPYSTYLLLLSCSNTRSLLPGFTLSSLPPPPFLPQAELSCPRIISPAVLPSKHTITACLPACL